MTSARPAMDAYLIRHTRVNIAPGICYGHADVPLADTFAAECAQVRNKLPNAAQWLVYSSPSTRCRKLAEQFRAEAVNLDPRLMELNFGDWEQQAWDAITDQHLHRWGKDFVNERCPNGESFRDMAQRVAVCWGEICQQNAPQVLIITHAGVIRALLSHLLEFPLQRAMQIMIEYGSVTKICLSDSGVTIAYVNR